MIFICNSASNYLIKRRYSYKDLGKNTVQAEPKISGKPTGAGVEEERGEGLAARQPRGRQRENGVGGESADFIDMIRRLNFILSVMGNHKRDS